MVQLTSLTRVPIHNCTFWTWTECIDGLDLKLKLFVELRIGHSVRRSFLLRPMLHLHANHWGRVLNPTVKDRVVNSWAVVINRLQWLERKYALLQFWNYFICNKYLELKPEFSLLHMKVITLIKTKSNVSP